MKVIKSENFTNYKGGNTAVAIGSFDGLHIGHQTIIKNMLKEAKKKSLNSGVFSFEPHPLEVVAPSKAPSYLLSRRQKLNILEKMGVDYFFEQEFTKKFSKLNFEDFFSSLHYTFLNHLESHNKLLPDNSFLLLKAAAFDLHLNPFFLPE